MNSFKIYCASYSRNGSFYVSLFMGMLVYSAYGFGTSRWDSIWLIATSIFVTLSAPPYSVFINHVDARLCAASGFATPGKLGRLVVHTAYNLILFTLLVRGELILFRNIEGIGGTPGAALFTSLAAQGAQYVAIMIADSGRGDRSWNILLCNLVTTIITALAMLGHPAIQSAFVKVSLLFGAIIIGRDVIRDARKLLVRNG